MLKQSNKPIGERSPFFYFFGMFNIVLDYRLTEYALNNGYFETNKFTQATSPLFHMGLLLIMISGIYLGSKKYRWCNWFLRIFCIIWSVNNIYSLVII